MPRKKLLKLIVKSQNLRFQKHELAFQYLQTIRDLDRLKAATAALADPRRTDPTAAEQLIGTARPIYYFNAALHSDETGSTEAVLELAERFILPRLEAADG